MKYVEIDLSVIPVGVALAWVLTSVYCTLRLDLLPGKGTGPLQGFMWVTTFMVAVFMLMIPAVFAYDWLKERSFPRVVRIPIPTKTRVPKAWAVESNVSKVPE